MTKINCQLITKAIKTAKQKVDNDPYFEDLDRESMLVGIRMVENLLVDTLNAKRSK